MAFRRSTVAMALASAFCLSGYAQDKPAPEKKPAAQEKPAKPAELMCPVMNKPAKKEFSAKHEGKDVYFCCKKCPGKFQEDPAKYEAGVKAQWAASSSDEPLAVQVKCPGTGKKINSKIFVTSDHGPVYFCCPSCKSAWEKDSSKMQEKLHDAYTYQTKCPVMGEPIDPAVSVEHQGKTVYFCCSDCIKEFNASPAKYMADVEKQVKANKAEMEKRHAAKQP